MARIRHVVAGVAASSVDLGIDTGAVGVLNRSTTGADVFVRVDGTNPAVDGNDAFVVPAGARRVIPVSTDGNTIVKLIASAAATKVELEADAG